MDFCWESFGVIKVQNMLSAYCAMHNHLRHYDHVHVVVRRDVESMNPKIVRIVSGGGSGHEPAHVGYVGNGMLTAAVYGELFASPSVMAILSAILAVGGPETPVLLVVSNYTGDRLNFGLAREIAITKFGYNVETLLVDDDCSIENAPKSVGNRGLAGTILINKIAGSMAAKGCDLKQIHKFCSEILTNDQLATVGFTFKTSGEQFKSIQIGRGIHGEPGITELEEEAANFERIIDIVLEKLLNKIKTSKTCKKKVLVMFNNLGGTSPLNMTLFANFFLKRLSRYYVAHIILEGTFMTSENEEGISVTLLHMDKMCELVTHLRHPVEIGANVPFIINRVMNPVNYEKDLPLRPVEMWDKKKYDQRFHSIEHTEVEAEVSKTAIMRVCCSLRDNEKILNEMDAEFGDNDTGSSLSHGGGCVYQLLCDNDVDVKYPAVILNDISEILQQNMGGTLGALLCIFFQAAAAAVYSHEEGLKFWLRAIKLGIAAIQKYALAEIGDRTMLDALQSGVERLELKIKEEASVIDCAEAFAAGCREGADNTRVMIAKAGRAAYKFTEPRKLKARSNDPGAEAIAIMAKAFSEGIRKALTRDQRSGDSDTADSE
ncbi:Dihydroxyacetone kinase [Pseudolycoriella hygida]|uniref:Triokinase/FMN cyclase n=1 Tax=Pseudolycoriella hygida TaxID=35572 RepID=A0A9Q0NEH3_9DIPT|nr:Dihydroxyacetone kinase [Pseudolycoriella hygida]